MLASSILSRGVTIRGVPFIKTPRNVDQAGSAGWPREFSDWTPERIHAECAKPYAEYEEKRKQRHRLWPSSPRVTRESVFPDELKWVAEVLPEAKWHRDWWAAKSSQTLALTLLAAAAHADRSLSWLPVAELLGEHRLGLLEVELGEEVLNERPYQTQLDFLARGDGGVIALEAKFTEKGFDPCRCASRLLGDCSQHVRERPYWRVAERELGLRETQGHCSLSLAYQPVRNIAAALAIADGGRAAAFVLVYDARNAYFSGAGAWPGWATVLTGLTQHARVRFAAVSWQQLLARMPLEPKVIAWAADKHGLIPERPA